MKAKQKKTSTIRDKTYVKGPWSGQKRQQNREQVISVPVPGSASIGAGCLVTWEPQAMAPERRTEKGGGGVLYPFHLSPSLMGVGRSVPDEGTREIGMGQDLPAHDSWASSPGRAWSVRALRAEGRGLEPRSPRTRPSHPSLLRLPLQCNVKATGPRPHFHSRPCPWSI